MLAIGRSNMGSSKPPNRDMPFGYSFDTTADDFPFPSPPAPAPGPSLLDDSESRFLDSFFDGVSSDQFNGDFFTNMGDGSDAGPFSWQDLPPTFMGTTSSFGQQPPIVADNIPNLDFSGLNGNASMSSRVAPSTTSPDVLAAASLLQNTRPQHPSMDALFGTHNLSSSVAPQPSSQSMLHLNQAQSRDPSSKSNDFIRDTLFTEMMFGSITNPIQPVQRVKTRELRWGSDSGFGSGQGFVAPPHQETLEAVEQHMSQALECLEPQSSTAGSTRPSSPVITRHSETHRQQPDRKVNDDESLQDVVDSKSKKRRKGRVKEEPDNEDLKQEIDKSQRKRKSKPLASPTIPLSSVTTESPTASKRRKSAASSIKTPRDNLTEDQKRENHIRSEQKRRTLIKEGFDDLGELVPELKSGGFSKSAVLVMTADYLEELIEGNKTLSAQLDELQKSKR